MTSTQKDSSLTSQINYDFYQKQWANAGAYLDISAGAKWYSYLIAKNLKYVNAGSVSRILDIGCGVGNKTYFLATKFPGARVTGTDFSETGIREAKRHYKRKNLNYKVGDISQLDNINQVDMVTFFEVLEHVDDWRAVLKNTLESTGAKYALIGGPTGKRYEGGYSYRSRASF